MILNRIGSPVLGTLDILEVSSVAFFSKTVIKEISSSISVSGLNSSFVSLVKNPLNIYPSLLIILS